jgi:protein-L-isoaspartate O-methyltransferase
MVKFYSKNAEKFAEKYEKLQPEAVNQNWRHFIPAVKSSILDVGAGSGRDAAWFAEQGHEVVAVEPADALRQKAQELHPLPAMRWINDSLPDLKKVYTLQLKFDLILLSAVWKHISLWQREKSMVTLAGLLNPGGRLVITLRHGPTIDERKTYPVDSGELHRLANRLELKVVLDVESKDLFRRPEVSWNTLVLCHSEDKPR